MPFRRDEVTWNLTTNAEAMFLECILECILEKHCTLFRQSVKITEYTELTPAMVCISRSYVPTKYDRRSIEANNSGTVAIFY